MYKNFKHSLREYVGKQIALQYYHQKFKWEKEVFNYIDWEANEDMMKIVSPTTRCWITKWVTHTLPIGKNMVRRQHWKESYCPRCKGNTEETVLHLSKCPHNKSSSCYATSLQSLEKWLAERQTHPDLTVDIIYILHS